MATSAVLPLSSCTSLDQWLMGERREDPDKVLILGAGLAGLAAAYFLKKNKVPFQIFEGSHRIGGRVWTLQNFDSAAQHAELGGEQIELEHLAIQNLSKELKVSFQEFNNSESSAFFEKNRFVNLRDQKKQVSGLLQIFQKVQQEAYGNSTQTLNFQNRDQFPKAVLIDQMSVAELLDRLQPQMREGMREQLEQITISEWGVETKSISALHLIHWMKDPSRLLNRKFLKISGGSSILVQALFDRVSGIVPEKFIRFGHRLTEIQVTDHGWNLIFQSDKGKVEVKGRRVICTFPPAMLQAISGWEQISRRPESLKYLRGLSLGTHGKVVASFRDRFWKKDPVLSNGGVVYTDLPSTQISEAGDHPMKITASKGILQAQMGGLVGEDSGLHSVDQLIKDLSKLDSDSTAAFENISQVQNWKRHPWSKGSRVFLKPGQFQMLDLTSAGLADMKNGGGWLMAGDAFDPASLGTMNAAVQSAQDAVGAFLKA